MRLLNKAFLLIAFLSSHCWADTTPHDPCLNLLDVLNRPTVAPSICVVKPWEAIIEMGGQYQDGYTDGGHAYNFPEAELRLGLPSGNEISVLPPNYIAQYGSEETLFGYTATVLGYKHQFAPVGDFIYGASSSFTLPSGDENFGSAGLGVNVNALLTYNMTKTTALNLVLGYATLTGAEHVDGGDRYNSFNPDVIVTWQPKDTLQLYVEVFGQTKTGPNESEGYNADAGIQYLITPDIEVDMEYGQRLSGQLGGYSHYFGAGGGMRF